jgi:hypothetical protein
MSASQAIEVVHQLKVDGFRQGIDFDFAFEPEKYGADIFEGKIQDKRTIFTFYDDKLATWFELRYT